MRMRPAVTLSFLRASVWSSSSTSPSSMTMACSTAPVSMASCGVAAQVAIVAVNGDEVLGPHQIDEQAQFFLAAVAADVDEAVGAVVADDVGVAAAEVVDDAEDALLVAGNDARAEHHGVAGVDVGVLVVVDGGAAERAHGLALRAADQDHQLVRRVVAHLAGIDDRGPAGLRCSRGPARSRCSPSWSGR